MVKVYLLLLTLVTVLHSSKTALAKSGQMRLVCYYDAINPEKNAYSHYFDKHLPLALGNCTHLIYSYAQILPKAFEIQKLILKPKPSDLKAQFPHLKIYLSLGGDNHELQSRYLEFLEAGTPKHQHFVENVRKFLQQNRFDGLDLAFPLPRNKPRKFHSNLDLAFKKFKKLFTSDEIVDKDTVKHKQEYREFVELLKKGFAKANLDLSMTVLPNVNSTWYFDVFKLHKNFEFINLLAFDFLTPERNPEEADYTAPIRFKADANRLPYNNIEYQVDFWINNGCPSNKLNLGIATYGRAWKLTTDSGLTGVPVVENTEGPAEKGNLTQTAGLLSWSEICIKLATKGILHKVSDPSQLYGNYAYWSADKEGHNGIWISYDDPEFAGIKAKYALKRNLGGVALYDLHHDDFQKFCMGSAFPILSSVSQVLGIKAFRPYVPSKKMTMVDYIKNSMEISSKKLISFQI